MDKIKYENFNNICRMCMLDCCTNYTKDSIILDIFHKLTDIHFETNTELPQQICVKCFNFINEINAFSMTCKQTHSALMNCLNDYKNIRVKEEVEIKEEIDEIIIEEHKIEFVENDTYSHLENEDDPLNIINSNDSDETTSSDLGKNKAKQNKFNIHIGTSKHIIENAPVPEINNAVPPSRGRTHKCDQCEKAFLNRRNLNSHKRMHSGVRPFQCDQCEKSFIQLCHLNYHKRVHSGERPYKCDHDQCEKSFQNPSELNVHKRVHTGERPYKCDQCEKAYTQVNNLIKHKRLHSGERPYKCDLCEMSFTYSNVLIRHKKCVHSHDVK